MTTRAWLLHPEIKTRGARPEQDKAVGRDAAARLEEARGLVEALDLDLAGAEIAPVNRPHPGTLFGSGKIDELAARFLAEDVHLVFIDGPVSPIQQRNLERALKVKILDRTGLILEIFGDRAATREGVMQVELAHLIYQKSRLVRSWTHLERQRGGMGFMGGPGETQIESDRRMLDDRIAMLRRQLNKVAKTRNLHRAARKRVPYPIVALVGYTNAGKSTLFNRITEASVLAKDMLFATLDPTMRAVDLPSGRRVILSDTVGFISDLPTQLVAAFRATLEEVLEADLLVHVRDLSHPETEEQATDVINVLSELGVSEEQAAIEAWNKIDLTCGDQRSYVENHSKRRGDAQPVSALTGEGMDDLLDLIDARLPETRSLRRFKLALEAGRALAWLYERGAVADRLDHPEWIELTARLSAREFGQFTKTFGGEGVDLI